MKFPKSLHAEGWDHAIDVGTSAVKTNSPALKRQRGFKAGAKPVSRHTPLPWAGPSAAPTLPARESGAAPAARSATAVAGSPPPHARSMPWLVGAGVGVLLIGGAVVMSRQLASAATAPGTPVVVGQVSPSPEDAQLQSAPPGAGLAALQTPSDSSAAPATLPSASPEAADPAPRAEAPPPVAAVAPPMAKTAAASARVAHAPAPGQPQVWVAEPAGQLVAAAPAPAPVGRSLAQPPEVMAQASPPLAAPAPVTAPATPPVVAEQAPATTPDPLDASITVQVRLALAADAALATVPIVVSTDRGVVTLEGQAPDASARQRATVVAANTTGVKAVDNRLTLPPVAAVDRGPVGNGV